MNQSDNKYPPEFKAIKERYKLSPDLTKNKERLSCNKCKNILIEPKQTECGCRFCENCIHHYQKSCPGCGETWKNNTKIHDKAIEKEILESRIRCINQRCNIEYRLTDWKMHRQCGKYQDQTCPNQCGEEIKEDMNTHLTLCKRSPLECPMKIMGCTKI